MVGDLVGAICPTSLGVVQTWCVWDDTGAMRVEEEDMGERERGLLPLSCLETS